MSRRVPIPNCVYHSRFLVPGWFSVRHVASVRRRLLRNKRGCGLLHEQHLRRAVPSRLLYNGLQWRPYSLRARHVLRPRGLPANPVSQRHIWCGANTEQQRVFWGVRRGVLLLQWGTRGSAVSRGNILGRGAVSMLRVQCWEVRAAGRNNVSVHRAVRVRVVLYSRVIERDATCLRGGEQLPCGLDGAKLVPRGDVRGSFKPVIRYLQWRVLVCRWALVRRGQQRIQR